MSAETDHLLDLMARLRAPVGGCPWDVEQTFASIARHTLEEAYEVVDAIERNDRAALKDELGDLLLQVIFHARMAEEEGSFRFADVAAGLADKLIRRHPHVFGTEKIDSAAAQTIAWEATKAAERAAKDAALPEKAGSPPSGRTLSGVAATLPAMTRALKLQNRAARVGFDWDGPQPVFAKIQEELDELRQEIDSTAPTDRLEDEFGDILFACVNLGRKLGLEPEQALRRTNRKFERRFAFIEAALTAQGLTPAAAGLDRMESLWQQAKATEQPDAVPPAPPLSPSSALASIAADPSGPQP